MGYFILMLITVFLTGCQSPGSLAPREPELLTPPIPNISDNKSEVEKDEPIQPRFCNDDIYTQHIRDEFMRSTGVDKTSDFSVNEESFKVLRYQLPLEFAGSPIKPSPRVLNWISYFTGRGRSEFLLWMVRSASYRETLIPLLQKEGLPPEFFFLAMIESGLSNSALSHAKASGTWQFMKPTAEHYGLQVNYWVDERRDPGKSTLAAARYLKDLYSQFGDWYLAMAAYNAGPSRVIKAMRATQSRDYWVLNKSPYLRPETKDYVPKLLAALIVASHAQTYGFNFVADVRNRAPTAKIALYNSYRVGEIATKLGVPESQLMKWNPELMQGITPPINNIRRKVYTISVPKGLEQSFASLEPTLERMDISDILIHRVKRGDTIASIARAYKVSVKKIIETNPMVNAKRLKLGQNLNVPVPSIQGGSIPAQVQAKAELRPASTNTH
ncbi:MAG: transglycosylase SLT domain-containing protein [Bdellovibrionota bacterium]|nr:MAG: LysM peptidoglycan-binding domain-containing protein [Pseudomonadota bacterium]